MKLFSLFGVDEKGTSGDQTFGTCPFCGKPKFYVKLSTGMWDCKVCGRSGNRYSFIQAVWEQAAQRKDAPWLDLSADRGLNVAAMQEAGLVWDGTQWLVPSYNRDGSMVQIQRWVKGKLWNAPGLPVALWGAEQLSEDLPVYVTEGVWDGIALRQLVDGEVVVVAAPGAGVWKDAWSGWLADKNVTLAYDHDSAGSAGLAKVRQKLESGNGQVQWVDWPADVPDGWDVRDFLGVGGEWEELQELVMGDGGAGTGGGVMGSGVGAEWSGKVLVWSDVQNEYTKWLLMNEQLLDALRLLYAVVLSNRIPGDPVWLFLVAPPGGCKTELLNAFAAVPDCLIRSTITPKALVSGFRGPDGKDPSLIPQLNGKTFILKDFTEILQLPAAMREEVYAVLRGAYDGYVERTYGNGITRSYHSHFSFLAGATPHIDQERYANLGERYLLYRVRYPDKEWITTTLERAISNVGQEDQLRSDLAGVAGKFLSHEFVVPTIPVELRRMLAQAAQLGALLRGDVSWDFRGEVLNYLPEIEMGTRMAKQLTKLLMGLCQVDGVSEATQEQFDILLKVVLDTSSPFGVEVIRELVKGGLTTRDLADITGIPYNTLRKKLEDLVLLGALECSVEKTGHSGPAVRSYTLAESTRAQWNAVLL